LLSRRPLVGIGLISYSFYLWHWPLLVFGSYWMVRPLGFWEGTAIAMLAAVLAALSWRFVEQPFRNRSFLGRQAVFGATAAGILAVCAFSLVVTETDGLPWRIPPEVSRLETLSRDVSPKRKACHESEGDLAPEKACALGAPVTPTLAVWGDSHGVELAYALGEVAQKAGRAVLQLTSSACPPGLDFDPPGRPGCAERNRQVLDFLLQDSAIDTVILVARRSNDSERAIDDVFPGFEKAIAELRHAGRTVVMVYPSPADRERVPQLLAREQFRFGRIDPRLYSLQEFRDDLRNTIARMDRLARRYQLVVIDPTEVFCPGGQCVRFRDGSVMLFDDHHPSLSAQRLLAPKLADVIARSGRTAVGAPAE
jgi:hypothetical protein